MCLDWQHTHDPSDSVMPARVKAMRNELDGASGSANSKQQQCYRRLIGSNELTNFLPGSGSIIAETGLEERWETKRRESDSTLGPKHRDQASGEQSYCRA